MKRNFQEAMEHRRTYYALTPTSPVSDTDIQHILESALCHVPSAFNSQSTRMVLLLGEQHARLWTIVKETLQAIVPAAAFEKTRAKIDTSFAAGYGTVLFYEDTAVIERLQHDFPLYADNMPVFAQHTAGMHQFAVWTMLEDAGLGASLQHYNPLIDARVAETWNIPPTWRLIAQMPFGTPAAGAGDKTFEPLESRLLVFK